MCMGSMAARVMHLMRTVPCDAAAPAFHLFDDAVCTAFTDFTGIWPTQQQWDRATRGDFAIVRAHTPPPNQTLQVGNSTIPWSIELHEPKPRTDASHQQADVIVGPADIDSAQLFQDTDLRVSPVKPPPTLQDKADTLAQSPSHARHPARDSAISGHRTARQKEPRQLINKLLTTENYWSSPYHPQ